MQRQLPVLMLMLLCVNAAWGQTSPPPDQAEQVRVLLERVQQLEKRVNELEAKQTSVPGAPAAAVESAANITPAQPPAPQPAEVVSAALLPTTA